MGRQVISRRFESTATQKAAETAKQTASQASKTASEYSAKAQQSLSRAASAAGPAITNAAKGAADALGRVGGPAGKMVGFVERMQKNNPPITCHDLITDFYPSSSSSSSRPNPLNRLLHQGRHRGRQDCLQGTEYEPSVCFFFFFFWLFPQHLLNIDLYIYSSISTFQTYFQNLWKQLQHPSAFIQSLSKSFNPQQARNISRTQVVTGGVLLAELLGFFTVGEMIGRFKLVGYHGETHSAHH